MRGSARAFVVAIGVFSLAWLLLRLARHPQRSHVVMMPSQSWGSTFHELYHAQPPASYDGKGGGDVESSARMKQIPRRRPRRGGRRRKPWLPLPLEEEQASRVVEADSVESELHTDGQLPSASSKLAHSLRCKGLILSEARCAAWYARRDHERRRRPPSGGSPVACGSADCHGHGVCDEQTGVCACQAGYNGTACEGFNLRECNEANDGLWHASHCAGECDEKKGYCWCPGKLDQRPMVDTCQVKHMPLEAFAALKLKPDPAWIRFGRDGQKLDSGVSALPTAQQNAKRGIFAADLEQRAAVLRGNRTRHADVVRRFWFGDDDHDGGDGDAAYSRGGSTQAGTRRRQDVEISAFGVPHAVAATAATGRGAVVGSRSSIASQKQRVEAKATANAVVTTHAAAATGGRLPPAEMESIDRLSERNGALYQKLAARSTFARDALLGGSYHSGSSVASSPTHSPEPQQNQPWCEATDPARTPKKCACLYDGLHGELCDRRHEPFCLNQCSGHGVCDPVGGGFCHCDKGYFGIDCSKTTGADGRVILHAAHAAIAAPRSPSVYVYELWDHTSLILQYRAYGAYCVHRFFDPDNKTVFNDHYAYSIETSLHEQVR